MGEQGEPLRPKLPDCRRSHCTRRLIAEQLGVIRPGTAGRHVVDPGHERSAASGSRIARTDFPSSSLYFGRLIDVWMAVVHHPAPEISASVAPKEITPLVPGSREPAPGRRSVAGC